MSNILKDGKVYQLINMLTNEIYVGSTFQSLHKRHHQRKLNYERWLKSEKSIFSHNHKLFSNIYEYGWECFRLELLENVKVKSKDELFAIEGQWIRKLDTYKNGLNGKIQNRSKKQYNKECKDKIAIYNKQYKDKNRIELARKRKERYDANPQKYRQISRNIYHKNKGKFKCDICSYSCGDMYHLNRHKQSRTHKENMIVKPLDRSKYKCEKCNNSFTTLAHLKRHYKSKKHKKNAD